jgi:SAM-dependent methyltransferase
MIASCYRIARSLYQLVPRRLRKMRPLRRLAERVTSAFASHDDIYDTEFYCARPNAGHAAPAIASSIYGMLHPSRVVDVGCGAGDLLEALTQLGCQCVGLECAVAGLEICRRRGLTARKFDIERDTLPSDIAPCDVVVCLEVAEHLPARVADRLVEILAQLSSTIVFTAATPGQGGVDHVNEQPHEYWIGKFEALGYHIQKQLAATWQATWESIGIATYYYRNLMIFRRSQSG